MSNELNKRIAVLEEYSQAQANGMSFKQAKKDTSIKATSWASYMNELNSRLYYLKEELAKNEAEPAKPASTPKATKPLVTDACTAREALVLLAGMDKQEPSIDATTGKVANWLNIATRKQIAGDTSLNWSNAIVICAAYIAGH